MTARPTNLSRRAVLRLGALGGAVAAALPLAACSGAKDDSPDPLAALLAMAEADAAAARKLAADGPAGQVADARAAQAAALKAEVDRLNRPKKDTAPAPGPTSLGGFKDRLAAARQQAESLVPTLPAYRAGLVAAVAAGCAGLQRVSPELGPGADAKAVSALPGSAAKDAVDSLQKALAAEHASLWVYGLVTAFLPGDFGEALKAGRAEHTARRDALTQMISAASATPVAPEAAYVPPKPVTDTASAAALVASAEADTSAAWQAVVTHTDDAGLRGMALQALIAAARRGTPWRQEAGAKPTAVALPGQPA
ncbi:ferritin-like domain-containing protein [Amycolatopsis benzoatilytica]|uniref:ferritin-like domain-containing protein n=1 Tax=Amycolatopsis benzoatilytica TaxID=346045 RepID=UPI0003A92E7E|nr:ferritin-like domain-containing protein [Amycolatopsis benzoatilytica]